MMSRHEKVVPETTSTALVSPMIQLSDASIRTRKTNASDRPTARDFLASRRPSGDVRIAMNTRLSMPRTISSAVSVRSAAQALASVRRSSMQGFPRQQTDAEEINRDQRQAPDHVR